MEIDLSPVGPDALATVLARVHEHYRRQVEAAVGAGRPALVRELAQEHADEALRCITGWPGGVATAGPARPPGTDTASAAAPSTRRSRRTVRP